jgi:hypothetical protein
LGLISASGRGEFPNNSMDLSLPYIRLRLIRI